MTEKMIEEIINDLRHLIHDVRCIWLQLAYFIKHIFRKERNMGQGFICRICGRHFSA